MKKLLLLLCLGLNFVNAQPLFERELEFTYPFGIADAMPLDDGQFLLSCVAYPPGFDSSFAFVAKVGSDLHLKWAKRYRGLKRDDFKCMTPLIDGNILIGGTYRQQFAPNVGGSIYKIDTAGNVIWQKLYSASFDDRTLAIFEKPDSSLMIFIRHGVSNQPTKVLHTDSNGNIITKTVFYDGGRGIFAESVTRSPDDIYYMAGTMFNTTTGVSDLFICAITSSNLLWLKLYELGLNPGTYSIKYRPDDRLILSGSVPDSVSIGTNNIFVISLDRQGNVIWSKQYDHNSGDNDLTSDVHLKANGNMIFFGTAGNPTVSDRMMFETDSLGNVLWAKTHPSDTGEGIILARPFDNTNRFFAATSTLPTTLKRLYTFTESGDAPCNTIPITLTSSPLSVNATFHPPTSTSFMVSEVTFPYTVLPLSLNDNAICDDGFGVNEIDTEKALKIFPNPSGDFVNLEILPELAAHGTVNITDMTGRTLMNYPCNGESKTVLDISDLNTGIYFIHLTTVDQSYTRKLLKKN